MVIWKLHDNDSVAQKKGSTCRDSCGEHISNLSPIRSVESLIGNVGFKGYLSLAIRKDQVSDKMIHPIEKKTR